MQKWANGMEACNGIRAPWLVNEGWELAMTKLGGKKRLAIKEHHIDSLAFGDETMWQDK